MSSPASISSHDEVVDFIGQFVRERYLQSNRPVAGALLAESIRQRFPNLDLSQFGDRWLAQLVHLAEQNETVIRNRNAKHLELRPWVVDDNMEEIVSPVQRAQVERVYVHPDVWRAFVFVTQTETCYFDKIHHRVVPGRLIAGQPDSSLVPIVPISAEEQQRWMRDFVESVDTLSGHDAPITTDQWWIQFPLWLQKTSPELEIRWRRFRTSRVVQRIREWAAENEVLPNAVFSAAAQLSDVTSRPSSSIRASHTTVSEDMALRAPLLAAIGEMSVEELKSLSIPIRYVLRHFVPR